MLDAMNPLKTVAATTGVIIALSTGWFLMNCDIDPQFSIVITNKQRMEVASAGMPGEY